MSEALKYLAVIGVLFVVVFISPPPAPCNPEASSKQHHVSSNKLSNSSTDDQNSQAVISPVDEAEPESRNRKNQHEATQSNKYAPDNGWVTVFAAVRDALIVIFTAALAMVAVLQVRIMRGSLKVTQQAADTADKSLRLAERAWVFFNQPKMRTLSRESDMIVVQIVDH